MLTVVICSSAQPIFIEHLRTSSSFRHLNTTWHDGCSQWSLWANGHLHDGVILTAVWWHDVKNKKKGQSLETDIKCWTAMLAPVIAV